MPPCKKFRSVSLPYPGQVENIGELWTTGSPARPSLGIDGTPNKNRWSPEPVKPSLRQRHTDVRGAELMTLREQMKGYMNLEKAPSYVGRYSGAYAVRDS